MTLLELRAAIVANIKAAFPTLKTCDGHAGRFDLTELKRISTRAPAVYVACLAIGSAEENGDISAEISWAAYVITRDEPTVKRDESALAIVHALIAHIPGNRWELDDAETRPVAIRAQNLYSASIDKQGIAMWAITWRQQMNLGGAVNLAELNAFVTVHADHSLAPGNDEPAAIDEVTLEQ
ncbi:MAG: DUF1834 family protein [Gammaproteobacteria bacterium]|nr:DUF1834 family protein [Gammaproteobacteria bacterium]